VNLVSENFRTNKQKATEMNNHRLMMALIENGEDKKMVYNDRK
jgi:hypothetical protein